MEVEGVEVDGSPAGEVFDLSLAQVLAGAAFDGFHGPVERTPGALDRGEVPQPMGVLLDREVQRGVGRMQVRPAGFAVGPSGHGDLTEDGAQAAGVAGLHARSTAPVGVPNLDPALPDGTQVHVVLE